MLFASRFADLLLGRSQFRQGSTLVSKQLGLLDGRGGRGKVRSKRIAWFGAAALALACSGCGGSGSGSPPPSGGGATPTPSPAPTPAPNPGGSSSFGSLGQTNSLTFASLGFSYRATDGGFGYNLVEGSTDPTFTPSLRLAAPDQLFLTVPGIDEGALRPDGSSGISQQVGLFSQGYFAPGGHVSINLVLKTNNSVLAYSAYAFWISNNSNAGPGEPYLISPFVYGVPTSPSALPASGIATYAVLMSSTGSRNNNLTVDFSSRTVTGSVAMETPTGPLTFSLQGVTFTGDGSQFSGTLVTPDRALQGTFEGRFTGPTGEELIGRYSAPGTGDFETELWTGYRQ